MCFYVVMCECCLNCFLSILFATCSGGQRVCAYVCACPGLYEEWGQWEALAAQAPPSVSLPPLASCALAEVVARRQTAKRQIAMPRETRNIVSYVQTTPGRRGGGWRNRQKQPEGPTDRQTQPCTHRLLRRHATRSRCTDTFRYTRAYQAQKDTHPRS